MTENLTPIAVHVYRGSTVESVHHGAICVVDAKGKVVYGRGDIEKSIFPRSAIKAFQALPLVETGAASRFGLSWEELALSVSSHGGEPLHAQTAHSMLTKAGRDFTCLECGAHNPMHVASAYSLVQKQEQPTALHNNCSGKHAGFICLAVNEGLDTKGYVQASHPLQQRITQAISEMVGVNLSAQSAGIDGCSIPAFAMPMRNIAQGFAKLGSGEGLSATRAKAAQTIFAAVAQDPFFVAGTGRFCTRAMEIFGARAFIKTGAEGVFCASLPELGLGVTLKCFDGTTRAAEVMMAYVLQRFLTCSPAQELALEALLNPPLKNWAGTQVGELKISA
jgi:L-asparaginase II